MSTPNYVTGTTELDSKPSKALLVGNCVALTKSDKFDAQSYVRIGTRSAVPFPKAMYKRNATKSHLWVRRDVFARCVGSDKVKVAFAIDSYLKWGFSSKGKTILVGGWVTDSDAQIDTLRFEDGQLASYEEIHVYLNSGGLQSFLDELRSRYSEHQITIAAPLPHFDPNTNYIGESVFAKAKYATLSQSERSQSLNWLVPSITAAAGAAYYAGAIGTGWMGFQDAARSFDLALHDPVVQGAGGVNPSLLDKIQQQRFFLNEHQRRPALSQNASVVLRGISKVANVRIVELTLYAPTKPLSAPLPNAEEPSDVKFIINVPGSSEHALDQGDAVMKFISQETGMSLHLERDGWHDVEGSRRQFSIRGVFHG